MGIRLDLDLSSVEPGAPVVVESPGRLRREQSYGFIRALWAVWLADGRFAVSVPPGAGETVSAALHNVGSAEALFDPQLAERLVPPVNDALGAAGLEPTDRVWCDACFACNASLLRLHGDGDCRRLTDNSVPPAEGLALPMHCFPDGIVYGVVADGHVVSYAFAHRTGVMEDRVADIGVATAASYRRRGYARTAVSRVVEHLARAGGEARYGCRPDNLASAATARSVGFVPHATSLVLAAPAPDVAC
jgi:ribosomal protein S18 acetylase RimI-like enzyme